MTIATLREFANKCNVKFEEHPIMKFYDYGLDENGNLVKKYMCVGYEFGMCNIAGRNGKSEWNWTWFETWKKEVDENTELYFRERYSMVNGSTHKGWRESIQAEETITRRLATA